MVAFSRQYTRPNAIHGQDMDLLNENRSLIHTGKFLRQPETGFEWNGWTELFVLLFDNYRESSYLYVVFPARVDKRLDSCHDKTQGEGWHYQVPSLPAGKSLQARHRTVDFSLAV